MNFDIESTKNEALESKLQQKIDQKTKPIGALGYLEKIAFKIGCIQQTESPVISKPTIIVFAGDHGIAKKGEVNPFPQEVTAQMVYNFLNGGAAINVFCKENNIHLKVVDAGVNHKFSDTPLLINAKIGLGTKNYQNEPAMTKDQCELALQKGAEIVLKTFSEGCNTIGFGEMGISNTSAASLLMSFFTKIPIENCVGSGTGLDTNGISKKAQILTDVFNKYNPESPKDALTTFGGFEIAMLCGALLKAASLKMTILVDGFIVTAALLAANAMNNNVLDYCVFCHNSNEQGHKLILQHLNVNPLLNIGLRLGEGTATALALPLVKAAVAFLNNMASFSDANISEKKE